MNDTNTLDQRKNECNELVKALAAAQLEIKAPKKDKVNPMFKSKYSSLDAIYEACREPLAKNGLVINHTVESNGSNHIMITTLRHVSGQSITCTVPMFLDKVTSQGFGSASTYARKSSVCSLLSLPTEDDDDGNAAEAEQKAAPITGNVPYEKNPLRPMSKEDAGILTALVKSHPDGQEIIGKAFALHKVNSIEQLPASSFELLRAALR